jgi:hypothetical protein
MIKACGMTWCGAAILVFCALAPVLADAASKPEIVAVSDELFVVHDYATITVSAERAKTAKLYIGDDQFVLGALPADQQSAVRATTLEGLKSKVSLVPRREDANLVAQVTVNPLVNIAIRSPKHMPARGFVMLGLCNFPIAATIAGDCDNLTYFYFADVKASDIFQTIFAKWLNAKFPAS